MTELKLSVKLIILIQDIPRLRRMKKKKLTQRQIAGFLGVSIGTVQRYEKESYMSMPVRDLIKLLSLLESTGINIKI
jgi:transcriptional regulator with XRE-family HTH domain